MSITSACPTCGNSLKVPDQMAGKKMKCGHCNDLYTVLMPAGASLGSVAGKNVSIVKPATNGAVQAAFWFGFASIIFGLTAGVFGFFRATTGYSHVLVWLGVLMGTGSVVLAVIREECGFTFPYSGTVISLIALAMLSFGLSAPPGRQGPGFGGPQQFGQQGANNRGNRGNGANGGQPNAGGGQGQGQGRQRGNRGGQGAQGPGAAPAANPPAPQQ